MPNTSSAEGRLIDIGKQTREQDTAAGTTIKEKLMGMLVANGLWEAEAETIVELVAGTHAAIHVRWSGPVGNYQESLIRVLWFTVKKRAIDWLTVNQPKHFALQLLQHEGGPIPTPEQTADVIKQSLGLDEPPTAWERLIKDTFDLEDPPT